jgi:hypothetical protein
MTSRQTTIDSSFFSQPIPSDYPNCLAGSDPLRPALVFRPVLLALLVAVCFIPRAWVCLKLGGIYADGSLYIQSAKSLEQGDLLAGLKAMRLNIYPVVLMLLHQLGIDWETAGNWWGVCISSLVVLPMFGWVRRIFDDRVALVACMLYAFHPKLIQWSPEVVRDPMFWFLFMLAIYLLWRAATEVRLVYFLAAGVAIFLAALTRFEGLLLFIPLILWCFWRWSALKTNRGRLILGVVLCLFAMPILVVLANVIFLHDHPNWELFRLSPLELVQGWLAWMLHSSGNAAEAGGTSMNQMLRVFIPTMTRGLSPVHALLMFGGMWGWRRIWIRRDHQVLFFTGLVSLAGIWIHAWHAHTTSTRYIFPAVLMGAPFTALGFFGLVERSQRIISGRLGWTQIRAATTWVLLGTASVLGLYMGISHDYSYRTSELSLGRWIQHRYGASPVIVGPECYIKEVNFYAEGVCHEFPEKFSPDFLAELVRRNKPDVVLLTFSRKGYQLHDSLARCFADLGLMQVDESDLPPESRAMLVFARSSLETMSDRISSTAGFSPAAAPSSISVKDKTTR